MEKKEFSEVLEKEDDMNKKLCKPLETIATINSNFNIIMSCQHAHKFSGSLCRWIWQTDNGIR